MFKVEDFQVVKLTSGEIVEWQATKNP